MILKVFPTGPLATNAYLIADPSTKQCIIIDPGFDSAPLINEEIKAQNWIPQAIWLTHSHWDHIGNAGELKKTWNIPIFMHALDAGNLRQPGSDGLPMWIAMEGVEPDVLIEEGKKLQLGGEEVEVIHTPGHTPGGVCFYFPASKILISGDTLFKGSIGNISFSTSQAERMWPSLKKLAALPPETTVYPGHGPKTTIGSEKWLGDAEKYFG